MSREFLRTVLWLVLLVGTVTRLLYVERPFDYRSINRWREADYVQVTRNFYRSGESILYPQVDWSGAQPGYVEMELPLVPWLAARLYRHFGYHEAFLRWLSALASIATLGLFAHLAQRLLPPVGALMAVAAFAFHPLPNQLATAMQPEAFMLLAAVGAMTLLLKWSENPHRRLLIGAAVLLGLAACLKLPAGVLGLVFAAVVLSKRGAVALRDLGTLGAAAIAVLPPLAWYLWSRRFWVLYGNSLGLSNETHLISWDLLFPPEFLWINAFQEVVLIFTPTGLLLALLAFWNGRGRLGFPLGWYAACWVFYIVAADTSADSWAGYYRLLAVPAACLLIGTGFAHWRKTRDATGSADTVERRLVQATAMATLLLLLGGTLVALERIDDWPAGRAMYQCAQQFVRDVRPDQKITMAGGIATDEHGHPVASNLPLWFAWMDRKGFNYPQQEWTLEGVGQLATQGADFWIVLQRELEQPELVKLEQHLTLVSSCSEASLFSLRPEAI